jgi:hypothetical protein
MNEDMKYPEEMKMEFIRRITNKLKDDPDAKEKDSVERNGSSKKVGKPAEE